MAKKSKSPSEQSPSNSKNLTNHQKTQKKELEERKKNQDRKESLQKKIGNFKSKINTSYKKLKDFLFPIDIYIKSKEVPKFYSFEKKFFGLYGIFVVYSFVLLLAIRDPENPLITILTFGNPFAFGNSIIMMFIVLSILFSVDKIRIYIFEKNSAIKQIGLYCGIFTPIYLLFSLVLRTELNFITYLLILSMLWLFTLASRFYMYSRKFSTRIEARFISKYSISRNFVVLIVPFFILALLVLVSWFYRALLVFIALDFFAPSTPDGAVQVYNIEMRVIMPLIYFSLVMTFLFIIFEFVSTRRKAETRRAGTFDNFTFALIVFFIFFFQIFQITIFLLLRPETVSALKATVGAAGGGLIMYIFIFEFGISMIFLYRLILKLGRTFGWRILIFTKDGLILFFLACVFAQTLTRFSLSSEIPNQEISPIGAFFMADKYVISILMIVFLGTTILIYYLKPHETSMFMRMQKEIVSEEEKSMEQIYKLLKGEYIRRGEPYPVEILERELIKATKLSKAIIYSLIKRLASKEMNIKVTEKRDASGNLIRIIDFLSITEQFEKKEVANKKAQRFLSQKLIEATSSKERAKIQVSDNLKADKATDQFISSLATDYAKKQKEKVIVEEKLKKVRVSFKDKEIPEDIKNKILQIIKKEYMYRIENPEKHSDFHFSISEIASQVQIGTGINPGDLYPILERLANTDIEFRLIKNPETPEDKKVEFLCIDDDICYSLASFRPEEYQKLKIYWSKNFLNAIKTNKTNAVIANLKRPIKKETEAQQVLLNLLDVLFNYYAAYEKQLKYVPDKMKLVKLTDNIVENYEAKQKETENA